MIIEICLQPRSLETFNVVVFPQNRILLPSNVLSTTQVHDIVIKFEALGPFKAGEDSGNWAGEDENLEGDEEERFDRGKSLIGYSFTKGIDDTCNNRWVS